MTVLEERMKRLQAASDSIAPEVLDNLADQGKRAAANMLLAYGAKTCLDAGGFVHCVKSAHEAALLHLISEGYVELTEKGRADESLVLERIAAREKQDAADAPALHSVPAGADFGQYL